MTELQQSRYDQLLRRVGDLKGAGSKVNDALSELFPVIDVEGVPGELLLLGGTQLCIGAANTTSIAAKRPAIQLFNPVDSGKLITVSSLHASTNITQIFRWAVTEVALTTGIGTETYRDGRLGQAARPSGQIRTDSTVAIVDANGLIRALANTDVRLEDDNGIAVLSPGTGLSIGIEGVLAELQATFFWRERVAEPSELNF